MTEVGRRGRPHFVIILSVFVLLVLLTQNDPWLIRSATPVDLITARATATMLNWCRMEVHQESAVLLHGGGFSYEIYYPCTGLIPAAILTMAMISFPSRLSRKLLGIMIAVPLVLLLNLFRLVSLFFIGVRYPSMFQLAHGVLWEGILILFLVGFFLAWTRRRAVPRSPLPSSQP